MLEQEVTITREVGWEEIGLVNNEAPGELEHEMEIGRVRNAEPGLTLVQQEIGIINNEAPGNRTKVREIGRIENDEEEF